MAGLLDVIKLAGMQAVDAANPVNVLFGEVTKVNPLEVVVDQRFTLTREFLVILERVTRYEVDISHEHDYTDEVGQTTLNKKTSMELTQPLVIRSGLMVGDKVLLFRVQGGQQYVIVDKVVNT
ncbi:DUF2577 domain-containing protein [Brevibacillus massiliensis]|uniref:DUF2577 domain-containing protein n=1 Tax=Brevibacillus massiliensis TaxID=1118054 RepID=UPI0002FE0D59|nr:DUF2577 domain-containing protein [Brevibacillus massiliensis]